MNSLTPRPFAAGSPLRLRARRLWKRKRPEFLTLYTFRQPDEDVPRLTGASLQEASQELLDLFRGAYPRQLNDRKYAILAARIGSSRDTCWFITDPSGKPCGYCHVSWFDTVNARIHHRVPIAANQAYFFDTYVAREHRGKGYHTFSIGQRLSLLAERGIDEGVTTISNGNTASVAAYRRFDATPRLRLIYFPPLRRTVARRAR